jgi:hypothetical protein
MTTLPCSTGPTQLRRTAPVVFTPADYDRGFS